MTVLDGLRTGPEVAPYGAGLFCLPRSAPRLARRGLQDIATAVASIMAVPRTRIPRFSPLTTALNAAEARAALSSDIKIYS